MKEIPLTCGLVTIVDDDVYEWASRFNWHAEKRRTGFYAVRNSARDAVTGKQKTIRLHREIMKPTRIEKVDHKFGDTLDNRRENLRIATNAENCRAHCKKRANSTSRFRGVHWNSECNRWQAQIMFGSKKFYLGLFSVEKDAAVAYDRKAVELFGQFSQPNFPVTPGVQ